MNKNQKVVYENLKKEKKKQLNKEYKEYKILMKNYITKRNFKNDK